MTHLRSQPRAAYVTSALTEAQVQAGVVEALRRSGWEVTVTSQRRAVNSQSKGLPDVLAVRDNCTLFIECKTKTGRLRPSQKEWHDRHAPHFGDYVGYLVARDPSDIEAWLGWGRAK